MRMALVLVALVLPCTTSTAHAALCSGGQRAVLQTDLTTGIGPAGAPDPRWVIASVPPGPAFATAPQPGWVAPGTGAQWISSTATDTSTVTREYQTVFAAAPAGFAVVSLSYAADDDVTWHVNGQIVGSAVAAAGSWHTLSVTSPFIRGAHNVLSARVTNHGGREGLLVRGQAWTCV